MNLFAQAFEAIASSSGAYKWYWPPTYDDYNRSMLKMTHRDKETVFFSVVDWDQIIKNIGLPPTTIRGGVALLGQWRTGDIWIIYNNSYRAPDIRCPFK